MATESQWRAVIKDMSRAVKSTSDTAVLRVSCLGTGRATIETVSGADRGSRTWSNLGACCTALNLLGIPVDPDPTPSPAPRLSEEGRAELLAQFTAAALTGLLAGWPDFPGESPTGEATTTLTIAAAAIARETLAAFEAATRESAEKGGE